MPELATPPNVAGTIDASWKGAAQVSMAWDYVYRRPAEEATTVYIAQYGQAIYVAFDAHQRESLTINQNTNGGGVYNDDHVSVAFFPQGTQGFVYIFRSNPVGARDQSSSENSAYAPQWDSRGRQTHGGYVVTMRIPLNIIRSGGSHSWRVQFVRKTIATGADGIWAHDPAMQADIDVNYLGDLLGIDIGKAASRPPARVQVYGLGEFAAPSVGGGTSRMGADLSVPVTSTSSFVATLHPDYSNVETDQQSIAPQEFPRYYQEVRPFFTQIASQFNGHFGCVGGCPTTLYTPGIPEFSDGYALEGTQGPATFAAFDAIGPQRTDAAQTLGLFSNSREHQSQLSLQRVSVDTPTIHDVTTTVATGYGFSQNHAYVFANAGTDRGTFVTDAKQGNYSEVGFGLADQTSSASIDYQRVGSQFQPVDGYTSHPGTAGVVASFNKTIPYSATSFLQSVSLSGSFDRYHDDAGRVNQRDESLSTSLKTRTQLGLIFGTSSSYLMIADGELVPFNQNGISLSYRANTATGSNISYDYGRYYHGFLQSWYRNTGFRLTKRVILSLEADDTHYMPDATYGLGTSWNEISADQLLERATLDWQFSHEASLDIGGRRIVGIFAPTGYGFVPVAGTRSLNATNLTAAFHFLALRNEFYVVYGDPSQLSTAHALFLKWIQYIGAPKGT
ncbi:MAG: hypothetical protein ACXVA3_08400 [Vulcanimicrobiaceae bacterium]